MLSSSWTYGLKPYVQQCSPFDVNGGGSSLRPGQQREIIVLRPYESCVDILARMTAQDCILTNSYSYIADSTPSTVHKCKQYGSVQLSVIVLSTACSATTVHVIIIIPCKFYTARGHKLV